MHSRANTTITAAINASEATRGHCCTSPEPSTDIWGGGAVLPAASDLKLTTQLMFENKDLVLHKHIFSNLPARTDLPPKFTY